MSRQYIEYNNATVGGPACTYATLSNYNSASTGMRPPVPRGTVSGVYIVPAYGAPGYGTLQYGDSSCSGYPDIYSAYRSDGGACNQKYVRKMCQ